MEVQVGGRLLNASQSELTPPYAGDSFLLICWWLSDDDCSCNTLMKAHKLLWCPNRRWLNYVPFAVGEADVVLSMVFH